MTSNIKYKIVYDIYNTYYIDKDGHMYQVYIRENNVNIRYYGCIKHDYDRILFRFLHAESIINYEEL